MSQDYEALLRSSNIPWFPRNAENLIRNIAQATFGVPDVEIARMFRPNEVDDVEYGTQVSVLMQRLVRWDETHPVDIFLRGFVPRVRPSEGADPDNSYNLRDYVLLNQPSIFIGTTHYYQNPSGKLALWHRRAKRGGRNRFAYEIFSNGGIDVNLCLGDHEHVRQHEIAFPGGIRPQYIRSAREYKGTKFVHIWMNGNFHPDINRIDQLLVWRHKKRVPIQHLIERHGRMESDNPNDPLELGGCGDMMTSEGDFDYYMMHGPGELLEDDDNPWPICVGIERLLVWLQKSLCGN